jgi:hypothetical protein
VQYHFLGEEMKPTFFLVLLFLSANLFPENQKGFFSRNDQVQKIILKYHAEYFSDSNSYFKRQLMDVAYADGDVYEVQSAKIDDFIRDVQKIQKGFYAFKVEQNYDMGDKKDKAAIIFHITDKIDLLHYMKIQGNDFEISNQEIIKWFSKWQKEFSYNIIGVGLDFIQADIITNPPDYDVLAAEIYAICPDVVDQGTETAANLAKEIKKTRSLYFWWD